MIFGGESLELQKLKPWFARHRDGEPAFVYMYGLTETTGHLAGGRIQEEQDAADGMGGVIGQPIPGLSAYILDEHIRPVPVGVPGELYVGGAGVARGYLNDPERTAERFLPDPFSAQPGERLYRSGYRARFSPDGDIQYVTRSERPGQPIGDPIDWRRVEATLVRHPAIDQVAVARQDDAEGESHVVAYLVTGGALPTGEELDHFLLDSLPEYMVPDVYIRLRCLPLEPSGRVAYHALPVDEAIRSKSTYVPPRDQLEEELAAIYATILGLDPVGVTDRFFEIGGHSLLAARLVTMIDKRLGKKLPLIPLFQDVTVARLARRIRGLC